MNTAREVPTAHRFVSASSDSDGVIRVVPTAEYEAMKGVGIAAPWPDQEAVQVPPWPSTTRVHWRAHDEDEWVEVECPAAGETFDVRPGESVRVDSPPELAVTM